MANKYNAKKIDVNGKIFDSKKEAKRYKELLILEERGTISDLRTQVPFILIPAQYEEVLEVNKKGEIVKKNKLIERKVQYVADFVYNKNGEVIVEDVKGYRKGGAYSLFVIKRKLMLMIWKVKISEV